MLFRIGLWLCKDRRRRRELRNYLLFNGKDSRDFKVYISGQGTFGAPARDYDVRQVPGRSGDLVMGGDRLQNAEVTYQAFIYKDFRENLQALRSYLLSCIGYCRLEDTYHPDEYRMALYRGGMAPDVLPRNQAGQFEITFEVQPQRWLKSGEQAVILTKTGVIYNPTVFESQPLLRVYGAGQVGIGSQTITITAADVYTDIDCRIMEAYKGTVWKNDKIELSGNDFPTLARGANNITLGSGITRVEITPRWWEV